MAPGRPLYRSEVCVASLTSSVARFFAIGLERGGCLQLGEGADRDWGWAISILAIRESGLLLMFGALCRR
jgi:hypothetical protein